MMQGQITDPKAALSFLLAGKATVTLRSLNSGNRFTYKVELADKRNANDPNEIPVWFVSLLNGPDNWTNYAYIGMIKNNEFRHTAKSKVSKDAPSFLGFEFCFKSIAAGTMRGFEFWHEGKCGRCGRKLTVPESVASGFGPECINMVGAAAAVPPAPVAQRNVNFDGSARQKPAAKINGTAASQQPLKAVLENSLRQPAQASLKFSGSAVSSVPNTDAEIRRRIEKYRSEAPENYSHDGELSEKEAFNVAYNMFRKQIEQERAN